MNQQTCKKSFVIGAVAIGTIAGIAAGLFAAHRTMGDMVGMIIGTGVVLAAPEPAEMGEAGVSAPAGRAGEMGDMKQMEMKEGTMQGMSGTPSGAVVVPAVARQLIGVRSAPAAYATLTQEIRAVGTVGYDERGLTQVTVKTPGWVRKVFVDSIGRPVRKGDPLFTLYSPDLLATQDEHLLAVKTQTQLAISPLGDAKANAASLVASTRERLRLWDVTDAQMAALERRGKAEPVLTVYAPSSGIVMKREALPGKYVEPGTTLYEVADLSTVWISADIYESEVAAVKLNQPASVTFAAYPGETFRGTVSYIYATLNAEARTVRVRVEMPNPGLRLKPGMFGTVTLVTDAARMLVVPKEAVLDTGLRQLVFMDRGEGAYAPYPVKLGHRSQDSVEVLEGIKEGDRIVTSANFLLDAESKLTSASSMQAMMGRIGMGDWQMRGAYEDKMGGMDMGKGGMEGMKGMKGMPMGDMKGMEGMKGMENMPGMGMGSNKEMAGAGTRQAGGLSLTLNTAPENPKAGNVLLKLKLTDQAGKPVTNAQVLFVYTMPMPGMTDSKATARHTTDGLYEGTVMFGMGGTWVVTVNVTVPGRPPVAEKYQFSVGGGGM
ncbi:MAG TPA: efflux RND transporter periplasmic adaptor subunit, partial [Nitrospiraceae bacterium]|nr:efflux RND transporter periplasmic adaptor subunit [Nitrospiraceae bacterium]